VAVAAVSAATVGPIYLASSNQSVTFATLAAAPVQASGLTVLPPPGVVESSPAVLAAALQHVPGGSGEASSDRYEPPIVTVDVAGELPNPTTQQPVGIDLDFRTGECQHLDLAAGHCPDAPDQVMLSTRSASAIGTSVGQEITPATYRGRPGKPLLLVGLYRPGNPSAAYWWGGNYFPFGSPFGSSEMVDVGFVTEAGAGREAADLATSIMAQLPLRSSTIRATEISQVRAGLLSYAAFLSPSHLTDGSGLPGLLADIELQEGQMRTIIAAVALELVLLGLLVLYQVAASSGAARSADLEIAELRGLPRRSVAAIALREPALLLGGALPIGLVLGWLIVAVMAPHVFEPGVGAAVNGLAIAAAAVTVVAGFAAAALASRSLVRPALATEGRAAGERRLARNSAVVDLLAIVLALAAVVELTVSHGTTGASPSLDPLASLTPGLLALAAGIAGARLLPVLSRALTRATRWSPRVGLALASRNLSRRPAVARRLLVLVIAVGLLAFSMAGYQLAERNQATQAGFQAGAPYVLHVRLATGVDLVQAVRAADPSGREAMAAVVVQGSVPTLAVDASRLAAVASWPAGTAVTGDSAQAVARYLAPSTVAPAVLTAAEAIRLRARLLDSVVPPPHLVLGIVDATDFETISIDLGGLKLGTNLLEASLAGACASRCELSSISLVWTPTGSARRVSVTAPLVLSDVEARTDGSWRAVDTGIGRPGAWSTNSAVKLVARGGQLAATFHLAASATIPAIEPADLPTTIPAVITTTVANLDGTAANPGVYPATGLDGREFTVGSRMQAVALPALGDNAVLIDLTLAERESQGPPSGVTDEVWCHVRPSAALLARLSSQGVAVTSTTSASGLLGVLRRSAPALGFKLFLFAAIGASLLALGSLMFSVASDSRRRAIEFAALAAVGVPLRVCRRALLIEQSVVVTAGVVFGVVSGLVAGQLSLSLLPEFPPGRQGPVLPTSVVTGLPAALLAGVGVLVVLLLGGVVASVLTMRRVRPEYLRMSP